MHKHPASGRRFAANSTRSLKFQMLVLLIIVNLFLLIPAQDSYGYQTGHISMNNSEITILINSTFEIIDDYENETETTTTQKPTSRKPVLRMRKLIPLAQCQKLSESQKYKILEAAGGLNQLFMADTVDEAAHNFAGSFPESPLSSTHEDAVSVVVVDKDQKCDHRCQSIKRALNNEIARRNTSSVFQSSIKSVLNDDPTPEACLPGNFIAVGDCSDLGEPVDGGSFESLCSECRGLFMLGSNCFPKIFNAVQCNPQEMGCIFDTFTDKAHGQCDEQSLSFKVLRNTGDSTCEDWIVEQIQLPVACQCALSKSSFLRAKPVKEL